MRIAGAEREDRRFRWAGCYEAIADKLLEYRNDRQSLIKRIHDIANHMGHQYLNDRYPDGSKGPLEDICPFTTMATFNRGTSKENRITYAGAIIEFLGVNATVPESFHGIPRADNRNSWFFEYSKIRGDGDIDTLWKVFAAALEFADVDTQESRKELIDAYDQALEVKNVKWNLSMGLYWVRPWVFVPLDQNTRSFVLQHLGLHAPTTGQSYLNFLDELETQFADGNCPVNNFPELSHAAWTNEPPNDKSDDSETDDQEAGATEKYTVKNVEEEGCFLERTRIQHLLKRLRAKKNLILQGPPGTGKTWLSKRLAFALMGKRDESRVRTVQFHPNLSYEDFVRGWRPAGDGNLALADGVFMEAIRDASQSPNQTIVVVIEEINRGNPAQIFGELLTLLEADKRSERDAVELCYTDADGSRQAIYIPENLYVIGTMNIADRSLALVDFALRRRFAFVTLEPSLEKAWETWVVKECGVDPSLVSEIGSRIHKLNERIAKDDRLGGQFRIGHSYVTPSARLHSDGTREWFREVVETEIGPLVEEYWFDSPSDARLAVQQLLNGW